MTRVVGSLGAGKEGRLHLMPSAVFAGVERRPIQYKVVDGVVDIELVANPPGTCWLVGWRNQFDAVPVNYTEKWVVPWQDEVDLDELRSPTSGRRSGRSRAEALDLTVWKSEAQEAQRKVTELERRNRELLGKLSRAEGAVANASGKLASLRSEVSGLQRKLANAEVPEVRTEVVEKQVMPDDIQATLRQAKREIAILANENEQLKDQVKESIGLSTHFSNLHAEIDRLKIEKQNLLTRIDELKQPRRSTSSLRQEMIANLDRLIDG